MLRGGSRRSGVSLIEIVVVLGILLLLLAFFLPLMFRFRAQAEREQGVNNLKNITLAMIHYADTHARLPPTVGTGGGGMHGSILFHALPFIEQTPLHNRGAVWQAGTLGVVVPLYVDGRDKTAPAGNKFEGWLATSNYAVNWLVCKTGENRYPASIRDGTSQTIAFTERYQVCNGNPCGWAYDRLHYWAPMIGYYSETKFQLKPRDGDCNPALPQGLDADRILMATCDGAVHTLSDRVSPQTWHLLLRPNDGQAVAIPPDD